MNPTIHEALVDALSSHRFIYLQGPNFSARSDALQHISHLPVRTASPGHDSYGTPLPALSPYDGAARFAYVGAEVYQSLTGLAATVASEVTLNAYGDARDVSSFCAAVGLDAFFASNPFELSGGQQALVAVATAALLRPRLLSLDCCLEQVDERRRSALLTAVAEHSDETALVVSDNDLRTLPVLHGGATITTASMRYANGLVPMAGSPSSCLPPRLAAPILNLQGIHFSYARSAPVLRGVDVELHPGCVYWLRGDNGAGKSTLSKLLAGVLVPQQGVILADGQPVRPTLSPGTLVSYHFQNPDLQLFSTTVWNEVLSGPIAAGCSAADAIMRTRHALAILGISSDLYESHPLDLPFVLRKRVAISATIAAGSPWLVLDEPSLGHDDDNTRAMAALVGALADSGAGVILISHSARLASHLRCSTLTINAGQVEAQSP